jgi:hypothetical protein
MATLYIVTVRVCLHDVSLMYLCVESAYNLEWREEQQYNTRGTRAEGLIIPTNQALTLREFTTQIGQDLAQI